MASEELPAVQDPYIGKVTITPAGDAKYDFGTKITIKVSEFVPLSVRQFWSSFDSYLELQRAIGGHGKIELEMVSGKPEEGIGATVMVTDDRGGVTREVLIEKDDVNCTWKIDVPTGNSSFSQYQGTASIESETADGCMVSYTFEAVLASPDRITRKGLIDQSSVPPVAGRAVEAARLVLRRDGIKSQFTLPVASPIKRLWAAVGDWSNVTWVQYATGVELITPSVRRISFVNGSVLEERKVSIDDRSHTLVYEIFNGSMPVRMYHGTVHLDAIGENSTQLTYTQQFIPKDGLNPTVVRDQIAASFRQRLAWVQQQFDTRKPH